MGRPKKPNREDGRYEIKCTMVKDINGQLIRKSFYSYISKEDAKNRQRSIKSKWRLQTGLVLVLYQKIYPSQTGLING